MNSDIREFLREQWGTASPNQYGSTGNPVMEPSSQGQRMPNGTRVSMGQAPPIGTTPEVSITAQALGVPAPDCGPKASAVIDPATGQWTCQPVSQGPGLMSWIVYAGLGYLAWKWWQDQGKEKHHHEPRPSEENEYDD